MAAKVNKKFAMFLVLAIGAAAVLIAGLSYLNMRSNAGRNVRMGDEAYQAGDLEKARDYYGRAMVKEPGNMEFLKKLEMVTAKLQPKTALEAGELYRSWVGILAHAARHDSSNPAAHLRLLSELVSTARRGQQNWNAVEGPAKDMWQRVPESNPQRYFGKVYRSMSLSQRVSTATLEELTEGAQDAQLAVDRLADDDLVRAMNVRAKIALIEKHRELGRTGQVIDEQVAEVEQLLAGYMQGNVGPELARMNLAFLNFKRDVNRDSVKPEQFASATELLLSKVTGDIDPGQVSQIADTMVATGQQDSLMAAISALKKYVQSHPEALDLQLMLARAMASLNDEEAETVVRAVLDAPQQTVGIISQNQWEMRKMAASLKIDIDAKRWTVASAEQRPTVMAELEAGRDRLSSLVNDPASDAQLLRANAKIAYLKEEFPRAAMLYDRLIRETPLSNDIETLYISAFLLDRVKQPGRAHERIVQALKLNPGNVAMLADKARLEFKMGLVNDAAATIKVIPDSELAKIPDLMNLASAILGSNTSQEQVLENINEDPIQSAIARAQQALVWGDIDSARASLNRAAAQAPNDLNLLLAMLAAEARAGDLAKAREHLARGLQIEPDNLSLLHWDIAMNHAGSSGDAIDMIKKLVDARVPDPENRSFGMLLSIQQTRGVADVLLARHKQFKEAEQQQAIEGMIAALDKGVSDAKQELLRVAPDNSRVLELRLDDAVTRGDLATAEQVVARARALDVDFCGGAWFAGSMELSLGSLRKGEGKNVEAAEHFQRAVRHFETAAERLPFMSSVWKSLAYSYRGVGNELQAERAFEQAYKCDPTDLEIIRSYFSMLLQRGDQTRALRVLRNARAVAPHDQALRHFWLQLEAESGNTALALRLRRVLVRSFPDDVLNTLELARLLSSAEPTRESILDPATNQPMFTEQRWARMTVEERVRAIAQAKADWAKQSDQLLDTLSTRLGDDLRVASIRANILKDRGDVEGGERVLQQFVESRPQGEVTIDLLLELARYQTKTTQYNKSVATLQRALELQDPTLRQADVELSQLYMQMGRFAKAVEHLEPLVAANPDRAHVNRLIECLLKLKRFDDAQAKLTAANKESGEDMIAVLLAANIAEGRGNELFAKGDTAGAERKFKEQRDAYTKAQALDPQNITPHILMAQSLIAEHKRTSRTTALDDALRVLDTADKIRANAPEVSKMRIAVHRERSDQTAALGELKRLVERDPDDHFARRDLALMYVSAGQFDSAISVLQEGIRANPMISLWHDAMGDLLRSHRNDHAGAVEAYSKAYELSPAPLLLWKLSESAMALASPDCRGVLNRLASKTQELEIFPPLRETFARALTCLERHAEAREQLKLAFERRRALINENAIPPAEIAEWFKVVAQVFSVRDMRNSVDASSAEQFVLECVGTTPLNVYELRSLSMLWQGAGDATYSRTLDYLTRAIELAKSSKFESAQIEELYNELASVYFAAKRLQDSINTYELILSMNPDHLGALNNFAYFTANELKNPTKAIPFAERAAQLAPNDGAVLDTAGWTHFLAGNFAKAVQYLEQAVRHQRTPDLLLHLSEAQLKTGDVSSARRTLDEASRLNPNDSQKQEILRVGAEIRKAG